MARGVMANWTTRPAGAVLKAAGESSNRSALAAASSAGKSARDNSKPGRAATPMWASAKRSRQRCHAARPRKASAPISSTSGREPCSARNRSSVVTV